MTVQLDRTGAHVVLDPDPRPSTILRADPEVVLALAAGVVSVDQAVARGDGRELAAVFAAAATTGGSEPTSGPTDRPPARRRRR